MATCINCGARFNRQKTADRILDYCQIYSDSDFGELCFDCAVEKFINETGQDPALFDENQYDFNEDEDEDDGAAIATWRAMVEESPFLEED